MPVSSIGDIIILVASRFDTVAMRRQREIKVIFLDVPDDCYRTSFTETRCSVVLAAPIKRTLVLIKDSSTYDK